MATGHRTMKKLFAIVFLLVIAAVDLLAQASIQRNNFSTAAPPAVVIGDWSYFNARPGNTNNVFWNDTGIIGVQNGGASLMWQLYGWNSGNNAAIGWGPGPASSLITNGAAIISTRDPAVVSLRISNPASTTANILNVESNGVPLVTVSSSGNLQASNGVYIAGMYRKQALLIASTATTNQIDGTLQNSYRWTNMVTNIVLQLTNVVEGQEIDYWFTGSTNTGPNYTVLFTFPNGGSSLAFRWGDGITNGAASFIVTNNTRVAAFTKVWLETSMTNIEAYFRYLPK